MNRQQRRAAARSGQDPHVPRSPGSAETLDATEAKPGFFLRIAARVMLAPWVLNRINNSDVEKLLASMALQAGKPEIARNLLNRIAMRKDTGKA